MKKFFYLLLVLLLFLCACSHDNDPYVPEITPASLVGTTFTDGAFFLTIEENSMISFCTRDYPDIKGRAEYDFRHGIFKVINRNGPVMNGEEVTEAYIDYLEGTFNYEKHLECDYSVIGPHVLVHMYGSGEMWKLKKDK